MNRLGMALYASSVDNDWPSLLALRPRAVVAIDPFHLPRALPPKDEIYWCWRPWPWRPGEQPRPVHELTAADWFARIVADWESKGRHKFHGIQFMNEPNYEGTPAELAVAWGLAVIPLIRDAWPDAEIHSPPLSPNVPGWQEYYVRIADLIDQCGLLSAHCYLDQPRSFEFPLQYYGGTCVISECGDRGNGSAEYGRALLDWVAGLPEDVEWAAAYVYNSTDGQDPAWEIHGTEAERVLVEARNERSEASRMVEV